jgi:ionotropic glutamate receptor
MDTAAKTTLLLLLPFLSFSVAQNVTQSGTAILNVGAILDLQSLVGKIARTSILMAMEDFYAVHRNYTRKMVLRIRDSNGDNIRAASEGTYQKL